MMIMHCSNIVVTTQKLPKNINSALDLLAKVEGFFKVCNPDNKFSENILKIQLIV